MHHHDDGSDDENAERAANENINIDKDKIHHHDYCSDDENAERGSAALWKEKLGDQQVGAAGVSSCLGIRRWEERYIGYIVIYRNIFTYILKYIGMYWRSMFRSKKLEIKSSPGAASGCTQAPGTQLQLTY